MEFETILVLGAIALLVIGLYLRKEKKADIGNGLSIVGVLLIVAVAANAYGAFEPLAVEPVTPTEPGLPSAEELACPVKDITTLNGHVETWKTNSRTTSNGQIEFYELGDEIGGSNVVPINILPFASGVGSITNGSVAQCTPYQIFYNGGAVDYDQMHPDTYLPFVDTTDATITSTGITVTDATPISAIGDLLEEDDVTGTINGQTTLTRALAEANPIQVGADGSPADGDTLYYNITNAADGFYLMLDVEATTGNARLKDPVMCFVYPMANAFEGGEITGVTVQLDSGTDLHMESDILDAYDKKGCVPLWQYQEDGHDWIDGGKGATYKVSFEVAEGLMDVGGADILYIVIDDCGEHNGVDIRGDHSKATAVTLQIQALA